MTAIILGITMIFMALLLVVMSVPLVQEKIEMNKAYGIRIKKAFSSNKNWYKINKYGGRQLIFAATAISVFGIILIIIPSIKSILLSDAYYLIVYLASIVLSLAFAICRILIYAKNL